MDSRPTSRKRPMADSRPTSQKRKADEAIMTQNGARPKRQKKTAVPRAQLPTDLAQKPTPSGTPEDLANGSTEPAPAEAPEPAKKVAARPRARKTVSTPAAALPKARQKRKPAASAQLTEVAAARLRKFESATAATAEPIFPDAVPSVPSGVSIPCPLAWDTDEGLKLITAECQEAYLLRAPWNPKQMTFTDLEKVVKSRHADAPTATEAYRKRFKKANREVFLATGVYYENSLMGLEAHEKGNYPALVPEATKEYKGNHAKGKDRAAAPKKSKTITFPREPTFGLFIQEPGGPEYNKTREVSLALASQFSSLIAKCVRKGRHSIVLQTTEDVVDKWTNLFFPGRPDGLPSRLQRLEENEDGHFIFTDWSTTWTMVDLFDVYCLSASMGSPDAGDMIIDHWRMVLQKEKALIESYKSGARDYNDVPAEPMLRILDFEPRSINALWEFTEAEDPARTFWLDVLKWKGEAGSQKIEEDREDYSDAFLDAWDEASGADTDDEDEEDSVSQAGDHAMMEVDGHDEGTIMQSIEQDVAILKTEELDALREQLAQLPENGPLNQQLDALYAVHTQIVESNETSDELHDDALPSEQGSSSDDLAEDASEQVDEEASEQGDEASEQGDDASEQSDEDASEQGESDQGHTTDHEPSLVHDADQTQFCVLYHNHTLRNTPCYRTLPVMKNTEEDNAANPSNVQRPKRLVEMTIRGVHGFKIWNHTEYHERDFKDLPIIYPEWEWEKVRAVVDFYATKEIHKYRRMVMPKYVEPRPIYFMCVEKHEDGNVTYHYPSEDANGRFPSHPGWRDEDWERKVAEAARVAEAAKAAEAARAAAAAHVMDETDDEQEQSDEELDEDVEATNEDLSDEQIRANLLGTIGTLGKRKREQQDMEDRDNHKKSKVWNEKFTTRTTPVPPVQMRCLDMSRYI